MKVIIATNNVNKAKEIEELLNLPSWEVMTLSQAGIESDPEETEETFLGNAKVKAYAARDAIERLVKEGRTDLEGCAILSDDSGLCVEALDGAPGIYSARFGGEDGNYPLNNKKLLECLEGVPFEKRVAHFETDVVFLWPDGTESDFIGKCSGVISTELRGEGGFGYDPLFMPDVHDRKVTMAELPEGGKSKISHRANAVKQVKEAWLKAEEK